MFGDRETEENTLIYKTLCGGLSTLFLFMVSVAYLVLLILKMVNPLSFTWLMMTKYVDVDLGNNKATLE